MTVIQRLKHQPPEFFKVTKPNIQIPTYMEDCMNGAEHPLRIEYDDYVRTDIGSLSLTMEIYQGVPSETVPYCNERNNLTQIEEERIADFIKRSEISWAVHNSFDGLYIKKEINYNNFRVVFSFAVYIKSVIQTYWLLRHRPDAHFEV